MPFGTVKAWGRSRDGCITWGGDRRRGRGSLGVNVQRPIVTNGDFKVHMHQSLHWLQCAEVCEPIEQSLGRWGW